MKPLRAKTHINEDNTLTIIPSLLKTEFGVETRAGGSCLISQFVFSLESLLDIDAQVLTNLIDSRVTRSVDELGYTLQEVVDAVNEPFWHRGQLHELNVGIKKYEELSDVVLDIIDGLPVMMIIDSGASSVICGEALHYEDGQVFASYIRPGNGTNRWHTYLAMGVDMAGFMVLRDCRHVYAYKGYLKLALDILDINFHNVTFLSVQLTEADLETWKEEKVVTSSEAVTI